MILHRTNFDVAARAKDDGDVFTFTAATENPVRTPFGPEILRMSGARLDRFASNPVVLDTHDRFTTEAVIGRAEMAVEGRELVARVTFADTPRAQNAKSLVKGGFVRAVSVGFVPDRKSIKSLGEKERDGDVRGPARIIQEWELVELSLVPVPADESALRRSLYQEAAMQYPDPERQPEASPAPAPDSTDAELKEAQRAAQLATARRELQEAVSAEIRAICPRGLEDLAETLIVERASLEDARRELRRAHAERTQPVGTPAPAEIETTTQPAVTEDDVRQCLRSL